MKDTIVFITALFLLSGTFTFAAGAKDGESEDYLCNDVIITALSPAIDKAIGDYYNTKLKYTPVSSVIYSKVTGIERPNGDRTSYFLIDMEIKPYLGPHITVGRDRILLELGYGTPPKVLKFEHLEDYPLPEHKDYLR